MLTFPLFGSCLSLTRLFRLIAFLPHCFDCVSMCFFAIKSLNKLSNALFDIFWKAFNKKSVTRTGDWKAFKLA